MKRAKTIFDKEKLKAAVKPTNKKVIIAICAIAVVAVGGVVLSKNKTKQTVTANDSDFVTRGDIEVTITGSAAVEPVERFEIIPKVSGDITYCPYEVGDSVQEGDVLYMFDSSDTDLSIERQRISMQQSENSYRNALEESEKLLLKAKNDGIISGMAIKVGQDIGSGTVVASVDDTANLEVDLPFTLAQIGSINVGDAAVITSSKHMSSVSGTVTHMASSSYAGSDGSTLYNVTVSFANPGAFYDGMTVGGSVGANISPGSGTVKNSQSGTVVTETEGTVSKLYYSNGDYVKKGTVIAALTSDTISDKINDSTLSYMSANISMRQTEKNLEDYNITSPISGTVITKNSKAGDTLDKTNSTTTMMVIADISKLKFELSIDELDVSKVHEGQEVTVTCDALPDETYKGTITNVSVEGTATNGVTTYSAEVEIAEPGNLRPSMNVDAEIIVESASNVLMVPTSDITTVGNKSYVFVKSDGDSKSSEKGERVRKGDFPSDGKVPEGGMPQSKGEASMGEKPEGGVPAENGETVKKREAPTGEGNMPSGSEGTQRKRGDMMPSAPEGYEAVEIQTGIANEDYTEVTGWLNEGQEIYRRASSSSSSNSMMSQRGGMPGGMAGMPGGMGGGPSGGMGGNRGGMR